jgi:Tol biopolymer transport system component
MRDMDSSHKSPVAIFWTAALAIALSSLLALLSPAAFADAASPGRNGAIAFARSNTAFTPSDIWIQTPSGKQVQLTATPGVEETSPAFSPDGRLIAYVRRSNENADIWLMKSNGSDKRLVVDSGEDDLQPSFFPGGQSLVFTIFDGGRGWTVDSVRIDGGGMRPQVFDGSSPVISPNGRWLAYSREGGGGGIGLRNLRTREIRRLTSGSAQELDFSPDGRHLVFTGSRRCRAGDRHLSFALLSVGLRDARPRFLRRSCRQEFISPAWSPNGRKIVFTRKRFEGGRKLHFQLAMMTAGGTPVGGAPAHRRGSEEIFPAWQPLR